MLKTERFVNVGCGNRFHEDWLNLDISSASPHVTIADLRKGIPLPDGSCDAVYNAAFLEHLRKPEAVAFVRECHRVLKPGGILRIGVPDLESICRNYLEKLEKARLEDEKSMEEYDWMALELLDQLTREKSGGEMEAFLKRPAYHNFDFIQERIGVEAEAIRASGQTSVKDSGSRLSIRAAHRSLAKAAYSVVGWLIGKHRLHAYSVGKFRLGGEAHQWMYDRFSLQRLLASTGFKDISLVRPATSRIPGWERFHLDTTPEGRVIKADLFFMEGIR